MFLKSESCLLQLRSVKSTFSRMKTASPAAQRGSTLSLSSPGPPALHQPTPSRNQLQSSRLTSSSTPSAVLWSVFTVSLIWPTAAPSAPAQTRRPLCWKKVRVSCSHCGTVLKMSSDIRYSLDCFICVCVIVFYHFSFYQRWRQWNNDPLCWYKRSPHRPHLEVQPQSDRPDPDQRRRLLHSLRAVEAAREGCICVRQPHAEGLIFSSGWNIHLWTEWPWGDVHNQHLPEDGGESRWGSTK